MLLSRIAAPSSSRMRMASTKPMTTYTNVPSSTSLGSRCLLETCVRLNSQLGSCLEFVFHEFMSTRQQICALTRVRSVSESACTQWSRKTFAREERS
mmetsp:Transcript_103058/g.261718  ORF Transcript_103058/g.261718 Transcript_103058/m.261718 type:complete len:97 (+) Transcript_103058:1017-1307(+)